jgi:hypothetical protein
VLPEPVSVAVKVGVKPATPLLVPSRRVIVTVEVATPSAITGVVPVIVEFAATGAPMTVLKVTLLPALMKGVAREIFFTPAAIDFTVQVEVPVKFVALQVERVLPVPLAAKVGTTPIAGFIVASRRTIVIIEASTPSAL